MFELNCYEYNKLYYEYKVCGYYGKISSCEIKLSIDTEVNCIALWNEKFDIFELDLVK